MISCTEFIPSYSELFTFLEKNWGYEGGVKKYWDFLFDPERYQALETKVRDHGIRGCWEYWSKSLNEEAADFTMCLNEKDGWFSCRLNHCPSKGRLLEMKQLVPYDKYCRHCTSYRKVLEKYGFRYVYDFTQTDKAACCAYVFDPKVFRDEMFITPETLVMDRRASDNKYLHRDFHWCMSMGLTYLGQNYGTEKVTEYLETFAKHFYSPLIAEIREKGLAPLAEKIRATYEVEEAADALTMENDGKALTVHVAWCPAVKYLKSIGSEPSKWYNYATESVMGEIAREAGLKFTMISYEPETGKAEYRFEK